MIKHVIMAAGLAASVGLAGTVAQADHNDGRLHRPRVSIQIGTPQPAPVYVAPTPGYGRGYGPGYGPGRGYGGGPRYGIHPSQLQAEIQPIIQRRMQRVQFGVQNGRLPYGALRQAQRDEQQVQQRLSAASADGVISRWEERQIRDMAVGIGRFGGGRGGGYGGGYGGGPR